MKKKKGTSAEELCNQLPKEFEEYVKYTRNLDFESKPDYDFLRGLLRNVLEKNNCEYDYFFEWFSEKPLINNDNLNEDNFNNDNNNIEGINGNYINTDGIDSKNNKNNENNNIDINRIDTDVANYKVPIPNLKEDKKINGDKKKDKDKIDKKKCVIF